MDLAAHQHVRNQIPLQLYMTNEIGYRLSDNVQQMIGTLLKRLHNYNKVLVITYVYAYRITFNMLSVN